MFYKNVIGTAALVFGLSANLSSAADLITSASLHDWSGFYAGLHAGRGVANADLKFDGASDFGGSAVEDGFSTNLDGQFAGVQVGYNWQKDDLFVGVEADATSSGIKGTYRNQDIGISGDYHFYADADVTWLSSLRARGGLVLGKAVVYATGGIAFAGTGTTITSNYAGYPGAGITDSESSTRTGWVLGGGIETKIASNMTARLEYLHYDFGSETFFYRFDPVSDAYDAFGDAYLDVDIVRFGVNMFF